MTPRQAAPQSIDDYIAQFPGAVQALLEAIRTTIRAAAPDAEETISYRMPTFKLDGRYLLYFAAYKAHIGLYPAPVGSTELGPELAPYAAGKGSLRFPLDQPIPLALVTKIVRFRLKEQQGRAAQSARQA